MPDRYFYPGILASDDLKLLHETVRNVLQVENGEGAARDPEAVARIVLRLYRTGLTEHDKLLQLAGLMVDRQALVGGPVF
ncbi:conserved protein of unknown function [Pseudorhizobium banfieldiae]|uniref:Uncharacterized protein n=1 Tax=Pseudorhizobium banfieldiae TaxID=1125847 RepID=L0NBP9_9HYPH|nr:hypothetical protein [Pseudorhizobium banfieldiae]CAD6602652.1 hypothetical protein RNT25_01174 [arsenite-oxidising bacterium NT-25]CCF18505.1 conserved protein of unknown function [Pseudorhizobium banfieldiae]